MSCIQEEHKTCDLDFRPMTLIINWLLEIVKIQVRAKFRQARCNRSRNRKKKLVDNAENNTALPSADNNNCARIMIHLSALSRRVAHLYYTM